jgi:hypothetical protein
VVRELQGLFVGLVPGDRFRLRSGNICTSLTGQYHWLVASPWAPRRCRPRTHWSDAIPLRRSTDPATSRHLRCDLGGRDRVGHYFNVAFIFAARCCDAPPRLVSPIGVARRDLQLKWRLLVTGPVDCKSGSSPSSRLGMTKERETPVSGFPSLGVIRSRPTVPRPRICHGLTTPACNEAILEVRWGRIRHAI